MKILQTTEYKKFKTIKGNRVISFKKVERLKSDFNNGLNLFPYCPLIVSPEEDGFFKIIDGQHRFTASKELKQPIYYVEAPDIKLRDIARMNSNTDKWSLKDFLYCYIKLGIDDYKFFEKFVHAYNLNYTQAVGLLQFGFVKGQSAMMDNFKDGEFKVKHYEKSKELMELVDNLVGHLAISRDSNLITAIAQLKKKNLWDVDKMKEKIKRNTRMIDRQASSKNYIYMLEQVYNVGTQKRAIIF